MGQLLRLIISLLAFELSASELFSVLVYSEFTPVEYVADFSAIIASGSEYSIPMLPMSNSLTRTLENYKLNAIFDFTNSIVYEIELMSFSRSHHVLYFSNRISHRDKWFFELHSSPQQEAKAIQMVLDFLNWDSYHLLSSEKTRSYSISKLLTNNPVLDIPALAKQEIYDNFIGRTVKPSGNWKVVAVTESEGAFKVLKALQDKKIYKERCGLILTSRATWGQFATGTIIISEEGLEFSRSAGEYEFYSVLRALDILYQISKKESLASNEELQKHLEKNTEDHTISKNFSVLNYGSDLRIVGNVTDQVYLDSLVYPGNATELNRSPPRIQISGNLGSLNFDQTKSIASTIVNSGILPMIGIINKDPNLLPNYIIEIHETNCGFQKFEYSYVSKCMKKHLDHLGVFYIDTLYEKVSEGNIQIFRENGITIPHTGFHIYSSKFYDKDLFPELFITDAYTLYKYAILPYIISSFRWREILVYFQDDVSASMYDAFMKNAEILEIKVKNKNMIIPYFYNGTFYQANEELLKEAVNSRCRIYVLLIHPTHMLPFIESLYDLGLRSGDAVIILKEPLSGLIDFEDLYGHDKEKVLELTDGSLCLTHNEYIGEYGEALEKQIAEYIYPRSTDFTCFQIDSLLLGVHTIDMMLRIGRDYENPLDMNYFMRQQLFTGCSGTMSIDSGGNGRNELSFSLRNFYLQGNWTEDKIGYYTIGITVPIYFSREIIWPNQSKVIPGDKIIETDCWGRIANSKTNENSIILTIFMTISCFLLVSSSSLVVWHKFYRLKTKRIQERREIMFEDGIEIAIPFIEAFLYILLGPEISVSKFLALFLDTPGDSKLKTDIFWKLIYVLLGVCSLWSFCLLSAIFLIDRKYPKTMKDLTRYLGLTMLPLFSKICFIPILYLLLSLYDCKEGTSNRLTDSFLAQDCNVRCWKGFHLGMSIFTLVIMIVYSISSNISSTVYDKVMKHVNIKTNPLFSTLKSIYNLLLVLLNFHLKEQFHFIFCICYLCLFLIWTAYVFKTETFNHIRLIFWQTWTLIGISIHSFVLLISGLLHFDLYLVLELGLSVALCISVTGLVIHCKYLPGYFYKKKGNNFKKLLEFAFTNRVDPSDVTVHQLDYRNKVYIEEN